MRLKAVNPVVLAVAPPVGAAVIRALGATLRLRIVGAEHIERLYQQGQSAILTFWHGQQLMMPLAYRGRHAHVLISQHRDGELIARIIRRFRGHAVRGSSTRGGSAALREMIAAAKRGGDLVVTPDGPKGPRAVAKAGVIYLAKATGLPIVPVAFGCSKKKSSPAGTASSCPIRSAARRSSGGRRYGWTRAPRRTRSR